MIQPAQESFDGEVDGGTDLVLAGKKLQWPEHTIQEQYQSYGHYTGDGSYVITTWRFCKNGRFTFFHQQAASDLTIINEMRESGMWMQTHDVSGDWLRLNSDSGSSREVQIEMLSSGQIVFDGDDGTAFMIVASVDDSDC